VSDDIFDDIELTGIERFNSHLNEDIKDRAYRYVTHSPEYHRVPLSELRRIRSKAKKLKRSYKKQQRKQSQDISKRYGGR